MRAWLIALLLSGIGAFHAELAHADESKKLTARLELERASGAESCTAEAPLAKAVETRLGRTVFGHDRPDRPDLVVRLRLDRAPTGEWRAALVLADSHGNALGDREILTRARACSALDPSIALVVALLVDAPPNPPVPPTPQPAEPGAAPPLPTPPKPKPSTPLLIPEEPRAPREPWRADLTASATAIAGVFSRLGYGFALGLGFRPPELFWVRLSGDFYPSAPSHFEPARGAELSLIRFGLALCPLETEAGSFRFEACAGQRVGWLEATGFGFDENQKQGSLAYALEAGASGAWGLGPVFLRLAARLEVPLVRNSYVVTSANGADPELFRAGPLAGAGEIGLGVVLH